MRSAARIAPLDGLRGIAIACVVVLHYSFAFDPSGLFPAGGLGVDVFFVLSGFLITGLLLGERARTGDVSLRNFWIRRACRLFPALTLLLVGHLVYFATIGPGTFLRALKWAAAVAFYVANVLMAIDPGVPFSLAPTWSLAVEEQFYVAWPLLLLFLVRRGFSPRSIFTWALVGGAVSIVIRSVLLETAPYMAGYGLLPARADGLLFGAALAIAHHEGWLAGIRRPRGLATAGACALAGVLGTSGWMSVDLIDHVGHTVAALAAVAMIIGVLDGTWRGNAVLAWTPLVAVGRVSYGIYLWNGFIVTVVGRHIGGSSWTVAALALAATAAITLASWFIVERPFQRLARRATTDRAVLEASTEAEHRGDAPVVSAS